MRSILDVDSLHPRDFTRRQRLVAAYAVAVSTLVLVYTVLYNAGMRRIEGDDHSIFRSFQTVVETMTTTGFGADSPWESAVMNLFMVGIQLSGILIGIATLYVLIIPLFERTPVRLDNQLTVKDDHVVIAEYQRDSDVLLDELEAYGVDYVLIDGDKDEARRLADDGYQAIQGNAEGIDDLRRATIERASILITDAGDRTASIVLTALGANEGLRVISFTGATRRHAALDEIGVDRTVAPHALIGRRLAEKATTPVTVDAHGGGSDDAVAIREVLVRRDSALHGVRIGDSPLSRHPDLTLVAGWFDGELRLSPDPDEILAPNTVLVVAGPEGAIDELRTEVAGVRTPRLSAHSRVIVAGFGEGGNAAVEALPDDVAVRTIDPQPERDPDVAGDATEPETLRAAEIGSATALVVTVDDDATALLTIAMARSLSEDVEILARVTGAEKAGAAFRAGADYVLSTQRVAARLVAAEAHGERVMDPVNQIRLVRADADPFAGRTLGETRGDPDQGWTIVGLARDGGVRTDDGVTVESDDELFVAGSDETIQEFEQTVEGS